MAFASRDELREVREEVKQLTERVNALFEATFQGEDGEPVRIDEATYMSELYGAKTAELLVGAGYKTIDQVREASDEELLAINGIAQRSLSTIREKTPTVQWSLVLED